MERLLKVATPLTALTGVVPDSVPLDGFVPMAMATEALDEVTVFPPASWTITVIAGAMATPAVAFDGWTPKASFAGAPTEMSNAFDVPYPLS